MAPPMHGTIPPARGTAPADYPPMATACGILAVLALATVVGNIDRQILTLIVAPIRAEFAVSDTQIGLLYGFAFSLCFAVAGLPLGRLVDSHNRRNLLCFGIIAWSLATTACGLAQGFPQMFIARMGVGIGEACLAPATYSLASDLFRREHLGRAAGVIGASTTVGAGLSLMIAGGLLKLFDDAGGATLPFFGPIASWRAIFLLIGPPGILVALLLLVFPEPTRKTSARLETRTADNDTENYLVFFRASAPVLVPILIASLANILAASGAVAWGPTSLMRRFGLSPAEVGLWNGLAMLAGGLAGPLLGGLLSDHWVRQGRFLARMRLYLIGGPLCVAGQLFLCFSPSPAIALIGLAFSVVATAAMSTAGLIVLQEVCPNRFRGRTVALSTLINNIVGLGLGPASVGWLGEHMFGALPPAIIGLTLPSVTIGLLATMVALAARKRFAPA